MTDDEALHLAAAVFSMFPLIVVCLSCIVKLYAERKEQPELSLNQRPAATPTVALDSLHHTSRNADAHTATAD